MAVAFGMRVKAKLVAYGVDREDVYRNVTEVHYNYPSLEGHARVAFESDIHGTGLTQSLEDNGVLYLKEFEVRPETEVAEHF
jgi:hypothetical protein